MVYNSAVMLKSSFSAANPSLINTVKDTAPYSDSFNRNMFYKTSFHCPGRTLIIQVSNKPTPDETTDDDWEELGGASSGASFVWTSAPVNWMRVKGVENGDVVYITSIYTER